MIRKEGAKSAAAATAAAIGSAVGHCNCDHNKSTHGSVRYINTVDDNDSDSTKTEQEEMEIDQLTDNEESNAIFVKNPSCYHVSRFCVKV